MFNQLEAIAKSDIPRTPVLGSRISKALEPQYVGDDVGISLSELIVQYLISNFKANRWYPYLYIDKM